MAPSVKEKQEWARYENVKSQNDLLGPLPNPNITVFEHPASYVVCILLILLGRLVAGCFTSDVGTAWFFTNTGHNIVTYIIFHYLKGTPFDQDQGKYARLTYWEQLDYGEQYTTVRKFYTLVPMVLFLIANHYCTGFQWWCQVVQFAIILIGKSPAMHKVRIFGIGRY
eukprot:comp20180_c0_seq1/m.25025 comp20180_c0_seq1/g.25025  ORF comp20180_c0_seq1/g.25025 comp20180_c0_seq1/m.25025 type:complete len:168 (-) comp20180_c0_seq1:104-607(-)